MFGILTDKIYQVTTLFLGIAFILLFIRTKSLEVEKAQAISEKDRVVADHNLKVANMEKSLRESEAKVSDLSLKLSTTISTLEVKRNEEVNKIRVSSNAIIASLQLRASRTTQPAAVTGKADSCSSTAANGTGSGLFREDSEFLVGEATRADEQRQALKLCYSAWDSVLKAVSDFNSSTTTTATTEAQ